MNKDSDAKPTAANNPISTHAFTEYVHELDSSITDTIDFGDEINADEVIELSREQTAALTSNPEKASEIINASSETEKTKAQPVISDEAPVKHSESTLMVDSPLLRLAEELDGEHKPQPQSRKPIYITLGIIGLIAIAATGIITYQNILDENSVSAPSPQESATIEEAPVQTSPPLEHRIVPIKTTPESPDILVNGVAMSALNPDHEAELGIHLIDNRSNQVILFADGYVPYIASIPHDHDFFDSPLEYEMVPSDVYQMSTLTIKAPKNVDLSKTALFINGKATLAKAEQQVQVVSGFPNYIHVRQQGLGDHLHVVWPTRSEETLQLPDLQSKFNAERLTALNIDVPKDYTTDRSFAMAVVAENKKTTSPGTRMIPKNELIHIEMTKNGRYPLSLDFDSTPFGSITVETYMQLSSRGIAKVKFDRKSNKEMTLCFRRPSEAICTDRTGETIVPSGKWELVSYKGDENAKEWFTSSAYETLQADTTYIFSLKPKNEAFTYNIVKTIKTEPDK